jgi:flagellar motor switch protein FliN/FliY
MSFTKQEWIDRFVTDLALVVGAMTGGVANAAPEAGDPQDGWVVTVRAENGGRGDLVVEFDKVAAEALARAVMAMEDEPSEEVVVDTLRELCAQTIASMVLEAPLVGSRLNLVSIERAAGPGPESVLAQIVRMDAAPLPLRFWGDIAFVDTARAEPPLSASSRLAARLGPSVPETPKLDVILDIDLPLTVRFGRTEMPLRQISSLGPGSVIDLGRSPDDPVDVLVSNQLVARGEVVIVGGNYGVRITQVFNPESSVRSLGGRF